MQEKAIIYQSSSNYYNQLRRLNIWEEIGAKLILNGKFIAINSIYYKKH